MMGRLTDYEEKEHRNVAQGNYSLAAHQNRNTAQAPIQNIPPFYNDASLPLIPLASHHRSQNSQSNRFLTNNLEERAQTSFQLSHHPTSFREAKTIRSCATSPTFKLPPIPISKSSDHYSQQTPTTMPPHGLPQDSVPVAQERRTDKNTSREPYSNNLDMKMAYENMMLGYFMPISKDGNDGTGIAIGRPSANGGNSNQFVNPDTKPHITSQSNEVSQNNPYFTDNFNLPQELYTTLQSNPNVHTTLKERIREVDNLHAQTNQQLSSDQRTVSVPASSRNQEMNRQECLNDPINNFLKQEPYNSSASSVSSKPFETLNQSSNVSNMLNELSMFISPQPVVGQGFPSSPVQAITSTVSTVTPASNNYSNTSYQAKMDPLWGRFSVLPPVIPSVTPSGGGFSDSDTASLMSFTSVTNAQTASQMGIYYNTFTPLSTNFSEAIPSAFTSPRYSARSSYSSRSRNKRALSNSPLSAEGIDINTIIRMSPTSLNAYLNGSRSSSSCVSPGSYGDKTGCYGHLSARNSSSSPHSGSSGNRRSASFTPQTSTPGNNNSSNIPSDNSNISNCNNNDTLKNNDLMNLDNLFVMQAMQDFDSGAGLLNIPTAFNPNVISNSSLAPEFENLHVLPQDLAAFSTEEYIPYIPSVLPPVHANLPTQLHCFQPQAIVPPTKPPPTYDQHMARKAILQKTSSSDSSQPSNSNSSSFESSEGDKTVAGSSGTDTESNRMYACRWLDCTAVFQDQDEFVAHIEKIHVDQKRGDDFVCFWKLCPRRLHPFNARYKLLVHMRIHSGDKPNKCTYAGCSKAFSRLENLKIHLRSHTGERPYSCTFPGCIKTFSNSSDRTKHQKTHHETKPYVCQFAGCGKRYTDPSSLRKHVKKSHPDKKEPDRKKIRSTVEELDPKDLDECLVIHSIKPVTVYDASPPERTDSGLGRSPRSSQPGSSSDHYPGLVYSNETHGTSSQTSPSSQHSSPPGQIDRDKLPPNNNSLRVPILPPIAPSPVQQQLSFPSLKSPTMSISPNFARVTPSSGSNLSRNSSSLLHRPRIANEAVFGNIQNMNSCSNSPNPRIPESYASSMRQQSRDCS
ncbi:zinc finger protein GLIS3 [Parasteatoda tepidariorum]|uniref:zinc finger protein GLIS3 n=1 Tax=Parasteatoda tepidariorum TaxID=114398 RepID=UPI00077FC3ED|nr:zinc finger protein GLIS3 [Parasteatoda tepidariorum]